MLEDDNDNPYNSLQSRIPWECIYNQTSKALTATVAKRGAAELRDEEIQKQLYPIRPELQ